MKFNYQDAGAVATLTITSSVFEFRKHNRIVDAALFSADVRAARSGVFLMKSVLSGKTPAVMRAYKAVTKELVR
ncbi:hypothetical protein KU75_21885 [Pectobacterium odoriferum]|uniref:Uncharacterized protein n=1 Tax=Pectobacterium odoriferum TaxID=78398 RepID=A0ABR4VJN1_9GAMM|nr:hypothetical protein [Pectobacterium odoriferum]KGA39562.1 hypothetical protein KU75_21885 [Pectobacterium odoriferum]